jgi:hypothetical protein
MNWFTRPAARDRGRPGRGADGHPRRAAVRTLRGARCGYPNGTKPWTPTGRPVRWPSRCGGRPCSRRRAHGREPRPCCRGISADCARSTRGSRRLPRQRQHARGALIAQGAQLSKRREGRQRAGPGRGGHPGRRPETAHGLKLCGGDVRNLERKARKTPGGATRRLSPDRLRRERRGGPGRVHRLRAEGERPPRNGRPRASRRARSDSRTRGSSRCPTQARRGSVRGRRLAGARW